SYRQLPRDFNVPHRTLPDARQQKTRLFGGVSGLSRTLPDACLVGVDGFEPTTTSPPDWCATRLRYTPVGRLYRGLRPACLREWRAGRLSGAGAAGFPPVPSAPGARSARSGWIPAWRARLPVAAARRRWCSPVRTAGRGSGAPSARRGAGSSGG